MIVQCSDKMFYSKPIWHGVKSDRPWLISFHDEQPSLYIAGKKGDKTILDIAISIAMDINGALAIGRRKAVFDNMIVLPPTWTVTDGFRFDALIRDMMPVPNEYKLRTDGVTHEHYKYAFQVTFPTQTVWNGLNLIFEPNLAAYLLKIDRDMASETLVRTVRNRLRKKFPDFKSLEFGLGKYGEYIQICR